MEETEELQLAREFPSLEERKAMVLHKADLNQIKSLMNPPVGVVDTVAMYFILIDSFGI